MGPWLPISMTTTSFSKPVDPILGQVIDAWTAVRPDQPPILDRRTGEMVHPLLAIRARRVCMARDSWSQLGPSLTSFFTMV